MRDAPTAMKVPLPTPFQGPLPMRGGPGPFRGAPMRGGAVPVPMRGAPMRGGPGRGGPRGGRGMRGGLRPPVHQQQQEQSVYV